MPERHPSMRDNRLLAALPATILARLEPDLESVQLEWGAVLYEAGETIEHAYFPTDAIVSSMSVTQNGASTEVYLVGCDGLAGIAVIMGGISTNDRAVVQSAGHAWRIAAPRLDEAFQRIEQVRRRVLLFVQALFTQMAQTAVCNRHHRIEQQLARWLLLIIDRLPAPNVAMTQEAMGHMLGVRREGITHAAAHLQRLGVIEYDRGRIQVLDRGRLQGIACECYALVKRATDRLLA